MGQLSDSWLTDASTEPVPTRPRLLLGRSLDNKPLPHHHAQIRLVHHSRQTSITFSTTLSRKSNMSNEPSLTGGPPSPTGRRASFVPSQKLSELFGKTSTSNGGASGVQTYPGSIAAAAASAQAQQRRRMSISTLGLSGSPTQTSPFTSRPRQESYSSNGSGSGPPSVDESAIEEGEAGPSNAATSPFARRMSFGARALRDVKGGTGSFNGRASTVSASSPTSKGRGLSSRPSCISNCQSYLLTDFLL